MKMRKKKKKKMKKKKRRRRRKNQQIKKNPTKHIKKKDQCQIFKTVLMKKKVDICRPKALLHLKMCQLASQMQAIIRMKVEICFQIYKLLVCNFNLKLTRLLGAILILPVLLTLIKEMKLHKANSQFHLNRL